MPALNQGKTIVVTQHNRYLLQPEVYFTEKQRQRRDENWALIEPIVKAASAAAFSPHLRNQLIEAVVC